MGYIALSSHTRTETAVFRAYGEPGDRDVAEFVNILVALEYLEPTHRTALVTYGSGGKRPAADAPELPTWREAIRILTPELEGAGLL